MNRCDRAWQAEALADGRLGADHQSTFERHLATCGECRRERRALDHLKRLAREPISFDLSELEHRRQRERLLERANRGVVNPRSHRARWWVLAAAMIFSIGFVYVRVHVIARPPPPASVARGPLYTVVEIAGAKWSVVDPGLTTRLSLSAGSARFRVDHLTSGQRFILALPDGEVEVRGTEFGVRVARSTEEVWVDSGVVVLRLEGIERVLTAGMHWARATIPPSSSEKPLAPIPSALPPSPPIAFTPKSPAKGPEKAAIEPTDEGASFAKAMAAFSAADYLSADDQFADFVARHPNDTRAEDALFLRAVSASRRGDKAAARERAHTYLLRYPNGFRAIEMRKLELAK